MLTVLGNFTVGLVPPPPPPPIDPALLYYYRFDVVDICNNNVNYIYNHAKSIYDASASTLNISQTTKKFGTGSYYLQTLGTNLLTINGGFSGLTNGSVSFAFWWYPTGSIQPGNNVFFFAGTSDGNPFNQIILFWSSSANPVTAGSIKLFANTYGATNVEITSTPFNELNQWYHIVFIVSRITPSNIQWTTYINNTLKNTQTPTNNQTFNFNAVRDKFCIGTGGTGDIPGSQGSYFDDFRVYNKALTAQNVSDIYNYIA
jgi:hypothetical protein